MVKERDEKREREQERERLVNRGRTKGKSVDGCSPSRSSLSMAFVVSRNMRKPSKNSTLTYYKEMSTPWPWKEPSSLPLCPPVTLDYICDPSTLSLYFSRVFSRFDFPFLLFPLCSPLLPSAHRHTQPGDRKRWQSGIDIPSCSCNCNQKNKYVRQG